MKNASSIGCKVLCFATGMLLPAAAASQTTQPVAESGTWQFTAAIYGWVPTIDTRVNFPGDRGSTDTSVSSRDVLNHLKFTFQGSLDVHNGQWGIFNDLVYVDLGGVKSQDRDFSIGNIGIPASATANLNLDLKSLIWTVAGEYRLVPIPHGRWMCSAARACCT